MNKPLENHLGQFLLGVSKKALSQHKDSFFIPTIPSLSLSLDEITNEKKLTEKLFINEIPSANPICWPHLSLGNIQNKFKEFFDIYELNDDSNIQIDKEKQNEVSQEIQCFDQKIQELIQKNFELGLKSQEQDQIYENTNILKSMNDQLEEMKAKKKDYIDSNLSLAVQHYKSIFETYESQDQMNKQNISIVDQNQNQIFQSENLTFSQFSYNSQDQQVNGLQEDSYEGKLAQILKGFGLGKKQSQNQLQKSIEEAFENLNVECEYSQIYFQRNWMPLELLSNENIGLGNKQISQWSNGQKHDQEQSAEFPYIVVGAVFCKNMLIKGFKSDENTKNILLEMQNQQSESYCLVFNCQEDISEKNSIVISEDSINIQSLRILGLILCPIKQFPKIICKKRQFPLELATIKISDYIRTYNEEEILDNLQNEQEINSHPNWREQVSQIIENLRNQDQILAEDFPQFQNYDQKQFFLKKYEENKIDVDLTKNEKIVSKIYKGLNLQMISKFKELADKYKILTNKLEAVFQEEIIELETNFQEQEKKQENIDFKELSKIFFIHQNILQKIYKKMKSKIQIEPAIESLRQEIKDMMSDEVSNEEIIEYYSEDPNIKQIANWENQIKSILNQLRSSSEEQFCHQEIKLDSEKQNFQKIFEIFTKFSSIDEQALKIKLQEKSPELELVIIQIFEANPQDYMKIRELSLGKNELSFLLENDIEQIFNNIKNPKQLKFLLSELTDKNPILCLKIFSELMRQNGKIDQQLQERQFLLRMNEKFTEIIETGIPSDIIDVFVKALLLQQQNETNEKFESQQIFEQFEQNLKKNYTEQEINNLKQKFDLIENNHLSSVDKQAQIQNLIENQYNKIEQNDFKLIEYFFMKEEKVKFYKEKQEISQSNDLEALSQIAKTPIALHYKSNLCEYKIFGEQMLEQNNLAKIVHLVIDNQNHTFSILNVFPSNEKHISINADEFRVSYQQIYQILQPWLQTFLGCKSLFTFIYNLKSKSCNEQNIEILKKIVQYYDSFKENQNEHFNGLKNICTRIQNQSIFREWYEQIKQTEIGQIFAQKFDIFWARTNVQRQILMQNQIKLKFQSFDQILDLKDFNRLRGRKELDFLKQDLLNAKEDGKQFIIEVIQQMFGYIIRRENIQQLVDHIKELQIFQQISVRFLVSLVLQFSNIELRQRLIYYLSEYYSVPLIIICQNQYLNGQQNLVYIPEIAFEMLEGIGIFNFGVGKRCLQFSGKSQLMNDMLFPAGDFQHQAFEQNDENIFSSGQVDVMFEKSFSFKRKMVIMDGQGSLCNKAIQSISKLTNIAIINFSFEEIKEIDSLQDLQKKIEILKQFNSETVIILVLRDAISSEKLIGTLSSFFKNIQNDQLVKSIDKVNKLIDFCILLENMSTFDKSRRLKQISPILQIINQEVKNLSQFPEKFKFTKKQFTENFLKDEEQNKYRVEKVQQVIEQSDDFIDQVHKIKDDTYQNDALPILELKSQIRQQILEIRNNVSLQDMQEIHEKIMLEKLEELKEKIKTILPSQILLAFKNIVQNKEGNRSLILYEIQKELRKITAEQLKKPNEEKIKLDQKLKEESKQISEQNEEQKNEEQKKARQEEYKKEMERINNDIHKKQISLEHFWRCLVFYMEQETISSQFNDKIQKNLIYQSIEDILKNGDCFELIDGENLEFKGEFIQEVINQNKKDKVLVVCVIGPQSSGKSTLMNFAFGTQFFTSAGRCTKGIYFTLQKFPRDILGNSDVEWLLMLDTEGLQSPERSDQEYDRKIVLFAMLSANIVIINSRGEINSAMTETLKMCCLTFDMLIQQGNTPQIIYTNGQNNNPNDKKQISQQVQDLKSKVTEASNSPTIEKTAEEILGFNDDKMIIFGFAYNSYVFQQEKMRGLDQNISFQVGNSNFGVETSNIFKKICELIKQSNIQFFEISKWLDDSKYNWNRIDKFSGDINAFANLDDFKNDQKVNKKIHELWDKYLNEIKMNCDILKISKEQIRLHKILKKEGKFKYDQAIDQVDKENQEEKDEHLKQHIFKKFEDWIPSQKGITSDSIEKYYKIIKAKMNVQKQDFMMQLQGKLKEEQMELINESGIDKFLEQAQQIKINQKMKDMSEQEKDIYLQKEFYECWKEQIQLMKNENKIDEIKKTYFDNLLKQFKLQNNFIQQVGGKEYNELKKRIDTHISSYDNLLDQNLQLDGFLNSELTNNNGDLSQMFRLEDKILYQMINDPEKRIFNENYPEKYLNLKELVQFEYHYDIISDMDKDLDRNKLKDKIIDCLNQKQAIQTVPSLTMNVYGASLNYNNQVYSDNIYLQSQKLQKLFKKLSLYGYEISKKQNSQRNLDIKNILTENISQICRNLSDQSQKEKFAQNFIQNLKHDKKKLQKQIEKDIIKYFHLKKVVIYRRNSPNEKIQDHIKVLEEEIQLDMQQVEQNDIENPSKKLNLLQKQIYFEVKISNFSQTKESKKYNDYQFKLLIDPVNIDCSNILKQQYLIYIAFRQLSWNKISQDLQNSVSKVLNYQKSDSQHDLNINNKLEQEHMKLQQVHELQNNFINKLTDQIDKELSYKLGLILTQELKAKISWCALIICWIMIYQKAEKKFDQYIKSFENKYEEQFQIFQQIAKGNISITQKNIQNIINESFKIFSKIEKDQFLPQILSEIEKIKSSFDVKRVYQQLDKKYLKDQQIDIYEAIKYAENQVPFFEDEAEKLRNELIENKIIKNYSQKTKKQIQENLQNTLNLFEFIDKQQSKGQYNLNSVANYFQITKQQSEQKPLNFQERQQLIQSLSPVIYQVLINILEGNLSMNKIQFEYKDEDGNYKQRDYINLKDSNGVEENYEIMLSEDGPLTIFTDQAFIEEIRKKIKKNKLIIEILQVLNNNKDSKEIKQLSEIDLIISSAIKLLNKELESLDNKKFDSKYFQCEDKVDTLYKQAIGCSAVCDFCKRKCELSIHTHEDKHNCNTVGHQQRVFSGGYIKNKDEEESTYPSLQTCDDIAPNIKININGVEKTWQQFFQQQAPTWSIEFQRKDTFLQQQKNFIEFWQKVGKKYCEDLKLEYISSQEVYDQISKGKLQKSRIEVIILDESHSMFYFNRWTNAVKGAKDYINFLREKHLYPNSVQLIIIFFGDNVRVVHNKLLVDGIDESIWVRKGWFTGTDFGKPLQEAFNLIDQKIEDKDKARINFYTDGQAQSDPQKIIDEIIVNLTKNINKYMYKNKSKLKVVFMSEVNQDNTLKAIVHKLNDFSKTRLDAKEMCILLTEIKTEELGNEMIETFQNLKISN